MKGVKREEEGGRRGGEVFFVCRRVEGERRGWRMSVEGGGWRVEGEA